MDFHFANLEQPLVILLTFFDNYCSKLAYKTLAMRKFLYLLTFILFTVSCNSKADVVRHGVKTLAKCCTTLKAPTCNWTNPTEDAKPETSTEIFAPLPAYSWDSKMMFY